MIIKRNVKIGAKMIEIAISKLKVDEFDSFNENILFEMPFKRKIRVSNIRTSQSGKTYFL